MTILSIGVSTMKINIKSSMGIGAFALGTVVVGTLAFSSFSPLTASAKADDKVYSHSFKNAKPSDVLAWMKKEGIQIKVDLEEIPERTLTLVFEGADRDGLVSSFAKTIGFQAEKRGDVYSLLKGIDTVPSSEGYIETVETNSQDPADEREFELMIQQDFSDDIISEVLAVLEEEGVSGDQMKRISARLKERIAKHHKTPMTWNMEEVPGVHVMPRIMQVPGVEMPITEGFKFEMGEQSMGQGGVRQALEQAMSALERAMSQLEGHGAMGMDPRHMAELEKELGKGGKMRIHQMDEKAMLELEQHLGKGGEFEFKFDEKEMQEHLKQMEKHLGKNGTLKLHLDEMNKGLSKGMKIHQIKMENIKKFIKSLTKDQKALAEKQGFLKPTDLTKDQRVLLELSSDKDIDMSFSVDGEKVRIKSGNAKGKLTTTGISA